MFVNLVFYRSFCAIILLSSFLVEIRWKQSQTFDPLISTNFPACHFFRLHIWDLFEAVAWIQHWFISHRQLFKLTTATEVLFSATTTTTWTETFDMFDSVREPFLLMWICLLVPSSISLITSSLVTRLSLNNANFTLTFCKQQKFPLYVWDEIQKTHSAKQKSLSAAFRESLHFANNTGRSIILQSLYL